jgi:hypothetical protein
MGGLYLVANGNSATCVLIKTKMIQISMHQMHISTNYVYSVMLWPNKLEIQKNGTCERADKNQTGIEPNPSKDRAMHERDNPSF